MLIPVLYFIVVSSMTLLCLTTDLLILFLTNKELQWLVLCRARMLLLILLIAFSLQHIEGTINIIIN